MRKKREEEEQKEAISTNLGLKRSCFIVEQEQHAAKKGASGERDRGERQEQN